MLIYRAPRVETAKEGKVGGRTGEVDRSRRSARSYAPSQGSRRLTRKIRQGDLNRVDGGLSSRAGKEGPAAEGEVSTIGVGAESGVRPTAGATMKFVISYGLLLLVILAALYFSRSLDPRDIPKPAVRINPH